MALRPSLLMALGVALGCVAPVSPPHGDERRPPPVAAEPFTVSVPRATGEPSAPPEAAAPEPVATAKPAATPELPPYEVTRRTTSPDGATWCILHVDLQGEAATETLRAAWADLRRQEATEWRRFTCRFSWPEGSVDVNEFMVLYPPWPESLESVRLPRTVRRVLAELGMTVDEGEIVIVEEGEDYVIFETEGVEIRVEKK